METTTTRDHWEQLFQAHPESERSWTEATPTTSIAAIERVSTDPDDPIIDIGGGASRLVDHLIAAGRRDVTVLDLSKSALCQARARVGHDASVEWLDADITRWEPSRRYAVWHDRAVFHFLTEPDDVRHYQRIAAEGITPGGHLVLATFAPHGPTTCSGLAVRRWSQDELVAAFSDAFTPVECAIVEHHTPWATTQPFTWVTLRRSA